MDISPAVVGVKSDEQAHNLLIQAGIEAIQARAGYVVGVDREPITNKRIIALMDEFYERTPKQTGGWWVDLLRSENKNGHIGVAIELRQRFNIILKRIDSMIDVVYSEFDHD